MEIFSLNLFLLLVFIVPLKCWSQQETSISNYQHAGIGINPGYAGAEDKISAILFVRNQWREFSEPPQNINFSMHLPTRHKHSGMGFSLINDRSGPLDILSLTACYAYKINFLKGKLGFGISGGVRQISLKQSTLDPKDLNDPELPSATYKEFSPDISAGLYYQSYKWSAGISSLHLVPVKLNLYAISMVPHYFGTFFYHVNPKSYFVVSPAFFLKYAYHAPLQADLSCFVKSQEVSMGVSYKTTDLVSFQLILHLNYLLTSIYNDLSVGYAYDHSLSSQMRLHGSNEFFVKYNFKIFKNEKEILKKPSILSPKFN